MHVDDLVVEIRSVGHFHTDVVVGEAVHHRLSWRSVLQQDRTCGADEAAVEIVSFLCRESEDTLTALMLLLRRDHMRNLQGFGARTFRVGEHVVLGDINAVHEVVGLLKILFRLATSADDDIHTDEGIGHNGTNLLYLVAKECRIVLAVHEPQHLIASALEGNVEVRHKGT